MYYIITNKWIKNKYTLPFVLLDYIRESILPDRKKDRKYTNEVNEVFHDVVWCLSSVIKMSDEPIHTLCSRYDPLESLDLAGCVRKLDIAIDKLETYITEDIEIKFANIFGNSNDLLNYMEFVPAFKKVHLSI